MTDFQEECRRDYFRARDEAYNGKAVCLTETQNDILRFVCGGKLPPGGELPQGAPRRWYGGMQAALPKWITTPYLCKLFGCDKETVRGAFEYLERRHLIKRSPPRYKGGRSKWEWLSMEGMEIAMFGESPRALGY